LVGGVLEFLDFQLGWPGVHFYSPGWEVTGFLLI